MTQPEKPQNPAPPVAPSPPLEFEFALNEQEYVHSSMILNRPRVRRALFVYGGLAIVYALVIWQGTVPAERLVWLLPLANVVNAALLIPQTRNRLRQRFRTSDNEQAVVRVILSTQGYRNESPSEELAVGWHAFSHFGETRKAILLYRGPGNALILPKSALSQTQVQEVLHLLREKIGRTRYEPVRGFPVAKPVS